MKDVNFKIIINSLNYDKIDVTHADSIYPEYIVSGTSVHFEIIRNKLTLNGYLKMDGIASHEDAENEIIKNWLD